MQQLVLDLEFTKNHEFDFLVKNTEKGNFALCKKNKTVGSLNQKMYPIQIMHKILEQGDFSTDYDWYLSQNIFGYLFNRKVTNLYSISCCFLDIDVYRTNYSKHSEQQFIGLIHDYCEDTLTPLPSVIMSSGRGYYLKWYFTHNIPKQALIRWNNVQKELAIKFTDFGADLKALDASRILRINGTINTKNNKPCRAIWINEKDDGVETYDFDCLADEVLPYTREQVREYKKQIQQRDKGLKPTNRFIRSGKVRNQHYQNLIASPFYEFAWKRYNDIIKLCQIRGSITEGHRMISLVIAMSDLCQSNQIKLSNFDSHVTSVAHSIDSNWDDYRINELSSVKQRFQTQNPYQYSNERIINELNITEKEQRQLDVLIDNTEKNRRRKIKRQTQEGRLPRSEYVATAENNRRKALDLFCKGYTQKQIADELGIGQQSVSRYLKSITIQ